MTATIVPPRRIRVDASAVDSFAGFPLQIVHLGQSVVVLAEPGSSALLTLTGADGGVMPGGASIPEVREFARIHAQIASPHAGNALVDLTRWSTASTLEPVVLALDRAEFDRGTILATARAVEADRSPGRAPQGFDGGLWSVRDRAAVLAAGIVEVDSRFDILPELIGAGPGTTPTGDDMVVGALAGLRSLGLDDVAERFAHAVRPLLEITTSTSRHYLLAAMEGRFGEHVHALVTGLSGGLSADRIVELARRWGASSGIDLLIGLTATVHAALDPHRSRSAA